jgi:hypothetical protein
MFQNSASKKFRPTNFTPLKEYHHLQSEDLGRVFLYLSDTLNPAVVLQSGAALKKSRVDKGLY